jgi:tRNA threonylcarbamoyladenosine modification (KEOPS) complex Cgi121 subunit
LHPSGSGWKKQGVVKNKSISRVLYQRIGQAYLFKKSNYIRQASASSAAIRSIKTTSKTALFLAKEIPKTLAARRQKNRGALQ